MKVLMLSTDQNIFKEGSEARGRMIEYGSLAEELHIIVYADAKNTNKMRMMRISENVFVYLTNTRFKLFYFWDAYKIGKTIIRNWKLEIRNSCDKVIVTSQDPFETGLVGYWLKKKFGIPLQIQVHTDFLSPYFWQESLKNKIRVLLGKWLVQRANCLRVVSQRIKESILRKSDFNIKEVRLPEIDILPIFVDVEKIKNTPVKTDLHKKYPGYDFIILMASRLTKEKNISMAIEAMQEIRNEKIENRKTLLLIVGDGSERKNLGFRIQDLGLENNVKIESWTDDLISYYKTADAFLNTSNYEGYGRTLIEASVSGCPVLTTDIGIASEIIEPRKSGIIIKPRDTKALVESILEIIRTRKSYRGQIKEAIIKNKNEYLSQYQNTFDSCASPKN